MAFDQSTRNRLQKFVSNARAILGEEFTRQLQATYGLDSKQGTVAAIDSLTHLDNRQRQTAHLLRETLAHYLATTPGKGEKDRTKQVLDRIVREQAFTVLNRLAALRMAEARGFLLESIAKAHSSKGFQLYRQLSGTAHGETGDAYRNYLFSLFDEFSLDLAVLFDRHSAQGRLFPRETALLELLAEINHHEIEHLWAEDETIGWIYQYFNSQEERKKMRAESQAPRNSRELAVRNQFFTPRYVVEFLTDNTLGRIWYEMTQGNTGLVDSCRYLVRRPTEIFLKPGETAPISEASDGEALSQEELLKKPVYIPHRPLKDPRSIRMLDPACGSMHFGLYAFDLFERIYLEAWQLEQQLGPDAFTREAEQQALQSTYESLEAFKQQIPKLIIEHNIHGVDIDPRAVQIAGLSLWQRAQRAWHQQGIKPQQRPTIVKSKIVCAEPMPGEKALLQEFTSKLNPPVLGQLLEVIFDKMQLAGEAGSLLKIEEEIQTAIHEAREQWRNQSGSNSVGDLFQAELDAATPQAKLGFDLRGIDDATFWDDVEQRILQALSDYADQAESNADQKRLFAEDAAKGFAFIDLCRKRFDVVLMNPPFGEAGKGVNEYFEHNYSSWNKNILCAFMDRAEQIAPYGLIASVIDRSFLNKSTYENFRLKNLITRDQLDVVLDLGWGVLDGANVEVSSTICVGSKNKGCKQTFFIDLREENLERKSYALNKLTEDNFSASNTKYIHTSDFLKFPNSSLAYDLTNGLLHLFSKFQNIASSGFPSYTGHQLKSERHFFTFWEIPLNELTGSHKNFDYLYNGGEYSRYMQSPKEVVSFGRTEFLSPSDVTDYTFVLRNKSKHRKAGVYFGKRGDYLDAHIVPSGFVFTVEGQACPSTTLDEALLVNALLNSVLASRLLASYSGQHKYSGYVNLLPFLNITHNAERQITSSVQEIAELKLKYFKWDESSILYKNPMWEELTSIEEIKGTLNKDRDTYNFHDKKINSLILEAFSINDNDSLSDLSSYRESFPNDKELYHELTLGSDLEDFLIKNYLSNFIGSFFGRWKTGAKLSNAELSLPSYFSGDLEPGPIFSRDRPNLLAFEPFKVIDALKSQLSSKMDLPTLFTSPSLFQKLEKLNFEKYFSNASGFFSDHISRYSSGRTQAPIYWPLQTPSGSYTLWIYYHNLDEQSLYTCVNDFVEPKLVQVEQDLNGLRSKSARSSQEEKELEKLSDLASELRDFRDELLRLAKFWKPNLNDGVQITAAPLWKLFQHKAWQKKLKETWEKLEKGDYDWAHLACSIWPERVLRKCHQDRSLAIAHDVEDHFWHEVEVPVKRGKKTTGETKPEWQPKDLSETELNALVKKLAAEVK